MRIGIGIPTKNRPEYLAIILCCLLHQTHKEWDLVLVDDGDDVPIDEQRNWQLQCLLREIKRQGHTTAIIPGDQAGPPQAHSLALRHLQHEWVLRLDDDLMPEPNYIEKLCQALVYGDGQSLGAVGGIYPYLEDVRYFEDYPLDVRSASLLERFDTKVQASLHRTARVFEVRHLYSSFLYRRELVERLGFPTCYSELGHREETDISLRIRHSGFRLLVAADAIAWHFHAPGGGIRSFKDAARLREQDEVVFTQRCKSWLPLP